MLSTVAGLANVEDVRAGGSSSTTASSDYEALHDWTSGAGFYDLIEDQESSLCEFVDAESELLEAEEQLRQAESGSSTDDLAPDVPEAKAEVAAATKAFRAAQKKARKQCDGLVRRLNGFRASGDPAELSLSHALWRSGDWQFLNAEQLEDLEDRFFADEVVRVRSGAERSGGASPALKDLKLTADVSRRPSPDVPAGGGCSSAAILVLAVLLVGLCGAACM